MSSLDHAPAVSGTMYKTVGPTAMDGVTSKRIGGAAGTVYVPAGMDTLLGIYAHMFLDQPSDDETPVIWGHLDTEDGFNLKPYEFFYPPSSTCGTTTSQTCSLLGEFYVINCPVVPGGRINGYAQPYEANSAEPFCMITYLFGKNITLPKQLDYRQGRHRWAKVNHDETTNVAAGFAPAPQYQFTLSARGGVIVEVGGIHWTTTQTVALAAGGGTFQINSADVPCMPMDFNANAYGLALGVAGSHDMSNCITRRLCSAHGERVVHIDAAFVTQTGVVHTDGRYVTRVEFIRKGE